MHEIHDDLIIRNHHKNDIETNEAALVAERLLAYLANIARPGFVSSEYAHHILDICNRYYKHIMSSKRYRNYPEYALLAILERNPLFKKMFSWKHHSQ